MNYDDYQEKLNKLIDEHFKLGQEINGLRNQFKRECTHKWDYDIKWYETYTTRLVCRWCGAQK